MNIPMPTAAKIKPSKSHSNGNAIADGQALTQDDRVPDITAEYQASADFVSDNDDSIDRTGSRIASSAEANELEEKVKDFVTSSQVMMTVLDEIRGIHPVIDVAVLAFKAVVMLDYKRRDNDQKVLVLKAKMLDMMQIFLQLQTIAPDHEESERIHSVENSLKELCVKIAGDIKSSGNFCDFYSKKRTIVKLLKSPIYEDRLARYIVTFEDRAKELDAKLSIFTAHKVHLTSHRVDDVYTLIKVIFQKVATPHEKELWKVIQARGGVDKCTQNDTVLAELLKLQDLYSTSSPVSQGKTGPLSREWSHKRMSSRSPSNFHTRPSSYSRSHPGYAHTYREESASMFSGTFNVDGELSERIEDDDGISGTLHKLSREGDSLQLPHYLVNNLKEELKVNIDNDLKRNMPFFKRKFNEQRRQLKNLQDAVIRQGDRVILAVREGFQGPHERVEDPELRAIWREMGWKLGVRVEKFVLTLHDYYVAQSNDSSVLDDYMRKLASTDASAEDRNVALKKAFVDAKKRGAERWALKHINMRNIAPLMEVFDGDASGYVSIWEANQVALLRPKDWSLLEWLAYWAAGRHSTIWHYRNKIGAIILHMHQSLNGLLSTNLAIVDHYLQSLTTIDRILCDILPCSDPLDDTLAQKITTYMQAEENLMEQKLKALNHEIDGPDTLQLIIGESQIERNLLPLIYLLLKHHLSVIRTGSRSVFDREELSSASETLHQIFDAVRARVQTLNWLFGSHPAAFHRVPDRFQADAFAFGMYSAIFRRNNPYQSKALKYNIEEQDRLNDVETSVDLRHPSPTIVDPQFECPLRLQDYIKGVKGFWTGHILDEQHAAIYGMIEFEVKSWNSKDGQFQAVGSYSQGTITMDGIIKTHQEKATIDARLLARPDYRKDSKLDLFVRAQINVVKFPGNHASGSSLPPQYTISGEWGNTLDKTYTRGICYFSQTPAWAYQFNPRIVPTDNNASEPISRVRSLWKFACSAVLHQVYLQKGLLRADTVGKMLRRIIRGAEHSRCQYLLWDAEPLKLKDREEMKSLLLASAPWDSRFYRSVARCHFGWATLHFGFSCSICNGVILGSRFYCFTCLKEGTERNFCSDCRHKHKDHSLLKMRRFNHPRDTDPLQDRISTLAFRPLFDEPEPSSSSSSSTSRYTDFSHTGVSSPTRQVRFQSDAGMSSHGPAKWQDIFHKENQWSPRSPSLQNSQSSSRSFTDKADGCDKLHPLQQCVSCKSAVDLRRDIYWSCIFCSDPSTHNYLLICRDCELYDRGIASESKVEAPKTHTLDHPILRVHEGPLRYHINALNRTEPYHDPEKAGAYPTQFSGPIAPAASGPPGFVQQPTLLLPPVQPTIVRAPSPSESERSRLSRWTRSRSNSPTPVIIQPSPVHPPVQVGSSLYPYTSGPVSPTPMAPAPMQQQVPTVIHINVPSHGQPQQPHIGVVPGPGVYPPGTFPSMPMYFGSQGAVPPGQPYFSPVQPYIPPPQPPIVIVSGGSRSSHDVYSDWNERSSAAESNVRPTTRSFREVVNKYTRLFGKENRS